MFVMKERNQLEKATGDVERANEDPTYERDYNDDDDDGDPTYAPDDDGDDDDDGEDLTSEPDDNLYHAPDISDVEGDDADPPDEPNCSGSTSFDATVSGLARKKVVAQRKMHYVDVSAKKTPTQTRLSRKTAGKRVRLKKSCPVRKCRAVVVALPRHLRMNHGWSRHDSLMAVNKYKLRKPYTYTDDKRCSKAVVVVDSHRYRVCPIDDCAAVIKRLPPHIRHHHGIKDESIVKHLLKRAKRSEDIDHVDSEHSVSSDEDDTQDEECVDSIMSGGDDMQDDEDADAGDDTYGEDQVKPTTADADEDCNDSEDLLAGFEQWLLSADGGLKSDRSANQHKKQAWTIVCVTGKASCPVDVFCKKSLLKKFLGGFAADKKFMPGTTKSYLASLVHFGHYLLTLEHISEESKSRIQTLLGCLQRWIVAFRKESSERALVKMDTDVRKLITAKDVQKFERSAVARDAIKLIASLQRSSDSGTDTAATTTHALSVQEYVLVRNYLLANIVLANANRSGVLSNMLISDVLEAREIDNCMVVSVSKHKTAWKHGPAKIVLTKPVYTWLKLFVCHAVPQMSGKQHNQGYAFVTATGSVMPSSMINKQLQAMWKKAELGDGITCTLVRKTAVTAVHQEARSHIGNLADLMNHQTSTAERCYRMANREKTCVAAEKTLSDLTGLHKDNQDLAAEASTSSSDTRAVWTQKQLKDLHDVFREEIDAGDIALQSVRTKLTNCKLLNNYTVRQVFDKLRREMVRTAEQGLEQDSAVEQRPADTENSDAESESIIPPSTQGVCKVFTSFEAQVLIEKCDSIIKGGPISTDRVKELLNASHAGMQLLEKFTMPQIINRLKYERKKLVLFSSSV